LPASLVERFYTRLGCGLHNLYGPTEAAVDVTFWECPREETLRSVPIGRPVWNTQLYVLDAHLSPQPIGVTGELYLGGVQVGRGYLNRPELTAEKFVPDPFSEQPGARLYRTGDLCRYLPDGNVEYLGRMDHQIKIRGFRIELGEIETALSQHPQVREAVVVAREDLRGEKRLAAYVVGGETVPNMRALREHLHETLPDYMVPGAFVFLEDLPLLANGKIDRKALPEPERSGLDASGALVAPRSPREERLVEIWQEVLGISHVSVEADFFDLGGHSLLMIRLSSEIKRVFGVDLSLAEMFKAPTVGKLAAFLQRKQEGEALWSPLVALQIQGTRAPLFCAPAGGGSALFYRTMAQRIGSDQPVYVFEPIGMNGVDAPHTTVEEMAAYYIRYMRTVQPSGPYHLCGFSFGGLVAYEMACQIREAGEHVGCLILFDTWAPGYPLERKTHLLGNLQRTLRQWQYRVGFHTENLSACPTLADKSGYMRTRTAQVQRRLRKGRADTRWELTGEDDHEPDLPQRFHEIRRVEAEAKETYRPRRYHGPLLLLIARLHKPWLEADPLLGWNSLASNIKALRTPGTHFSLLEEPCVHVTLKHMRDALEATESEWAAPGVSS